ncbi:MAG: aminotransferase, partial [Acidobacteriota bacterium]
MHTPRRSFLRTAMAASAVPLLAPRFLDALETRLDAYAGLSAADAVAQEDFWAEIRKAFPVHPYINLENGYSSPQPAPTYEAFQRHQREVNDGLSFYMRRKRAADVVDVKGQLA